MGCQILFIVKDWYRTIYMTNFIWDLLLALKKWCLIHVIQTGTLQDTKVTFIGAWTQSQFWLVEKRLVKRSFEA
ncbi:hypothetical protein C5471_02180 [Photorhabdus tasmaniensis]|uniref:Uncharacterized protein n=1 Tax=Photorhabdus tasmaniensis TaxID=1004159 RepID=A0ABX0GCU8_9GAMM|nr:hypothetical protein [Photorhabdus tasmaniensis]